MEVEAGAAAWIKEDEVEEEPAEEQQEEEEEEEEGVDAVLRAQLLQVLHSKKSLQAVVEAFVASGIHKDKGWSSTPPQQGTGGGPDVTHIARRLYTMVQADPSLSMLQVTG